MRFVIEAKIELATSVSELEANIRRLWQRLDEITSSVVLSDLSSIHSDNVTTFGNDVQPIPIPSVIDLNNSMIEELINPNLSDSNSSAKRDKNDSISDTGMDTYPHLRGDTHVMKTQSIPLAHPTNDDIQIFDRVGSFPFYRDILLCTALVIIAGLMSGLTLGLLGMNMNTLEILSHQGTPKEICYSNRILPLVRRHHLLLVTLLLANASAMEALPVFLQRLVPDWLAIIVSVTVVLFFGEIIPQAVISRWALPIAGRIYWLVWIIIFLLYPISWPIAKILDFLLGHKAVVLYKRNQLKEFVDYHAADSFEAQDTLISLSDCRDDADYPKKNGFIRVSSSNTRDNDHFPIEERLTKDEVLIIKGALDLTSKTVQFSMTPLDKIFSLCLSDPLDEDNLQKILDSGHSRIPIWTGDRWNLVGMILVKMINIKKYLKEDYSILPNMKELPLVSYKTPLYTMLNMFQTGRSHIASVVNCQGAAIGIITLEDIIEELIQEEIQDETDCMP